MQLAQTGNVLINTTTDAGFRLDVNGTARVKTDLKIETATGGLTIEGDAGGYPTLKINTLRSGTTRRNWMFATEQFNGGDFVLFRSATGGGAANTLVYSIFNNGNVGINTTTDAGFKLDVNGTARVSGNVTGLKFVATNNGDSFMVNGFGVLDYGDGCRINYATGAQKVTIYSNVSGGGMSLHNSGNVSIGSTATEVTSAILNVPSTTKGFLPPRMTTTQKNAIASPAAGLMVYDTTLNLMSVYNGTSWI
jgi:hypothetical protein